MTMTPGLRKFALTTHVTSSVGWLGAALLTGIVQSLATTWGLFRHYWIVTKLLLTVLAVVGIAVACTTRLVAQRVSLGDGGAGRIEPTIEVLQTFA